MMLTKEDLGAISQLLDSELYPIEDKLDNVEARISSLENRMSSMETQISSLENRMSSMETQISSLETKVSSVENKVINIEVSIENEMKPRLNDISSCYSSTYERYKDSVEEHESMKTDIDIIKKVVTEHSEKLQQLA